MRQLLFALLVSAAGWAGEEAPFRLGAWVGADPYAWGDMTGLGEDSASTIDAICADLAGMGCNTVWVAGFAPWFAEEPVLEMWLASAERHGLKVVVEGSGTPFAIPKGAPDVLERTRSEVIPKWVEIARTYGTHPAVLAWCPVEEIGDNVEGGETTTLDALAEVGRAVAEVDPVHPVTTIHISTWPNVAIAEGEVRGDDMRVQVADLYPFAYVHDGSNPEFAWETSDEQTRGFLDWTGKHCGMAASRGIPFWLFGQANESTWVKRNERGDVETRPCFRMPTIAEMRFQVWGAVLCGAKGVFFFPYTPTPEPTEETRATLNEWERGIGMRTQDGVATPSHDGLASVGKRLRPLLPLLGRLEPLGESHEDGWVLRRDFQDPLDGRRYAVLVNRDVEEVQEVPSSLSPGPKSPARLEPGDGALVPLD